MKILHITHNDFSGGACRSAVRIHQALLRQGVDSEMLVAEQQLGLETVHGGSSAQARIWSQIRNFISWPLHLSRGRSHCVPFSFNLLPSTLASKIKTFSPDIVQLHWVNKELIDIFSLGRISTPIVWTLHDSWPINGCSHHDCDELCAVLNQAGLEDLADICQYSPVERWLNKSILALKQRLWKSSDIHWVGPSRWMLRKITASGFQQRSAINIPNPIMLDVYRPWSKSYAREIYNIPHDADVILMGAVDIESNPLKGVGFVPRILSSLHAVKTQEKIIVLVFGSSYSTAIQTDGCDIRFVGRLHDDISLALLYSAADVYISPSVIENLPNTILEAGACGTVSVAFDVGGTGDLISHKLTGYLARAFDVEDFVQGIFWGLAGSRSGCISDRLRQTIADGFSEEVVARQYIQLYKKVLKC